MMGENIKKQSSKLATKEYLQQMNYLDSIVNAKIEKLSYLKNLSTSVQGSKLTLLPSHKGANDKLGSIVSKIIDLEEEINQEIDRLIDLKKEIIAKIDGVESNTYRLLLTLRYVNFKTWEQVADYMNYDYKHAYRIHDKALQAFAKQYSV